METESGWNPVRYYLPRFQPLIFPACSSAISQLSFAVYTVQ